SHFLAQALPSDPPPASARAPRDPPTCCVNPRPTPRMARGRRSATAALLGAAALWAGRAFVLAPGGPGHPAAAAARLVARRSGAPVDGGNLGGDFWAHPWAEALGKSPKGDDIVFDDVVEHFNRLREEDGLDPLMEGSSPLVILEGIVTNSEQSGQKGLNKAERIADGIQASSFLLSELTE
ncbi:unnamed protein product, partial [Prorocentrum cordatum]